MMRLTIAVKDESGKVYSLPERYEFAPEDLDQLVADFRSYCCSDANGAATGGAYHCKIGSEDKMLFLKFNEIVYMG